MDDAVIYREEVLTTMGVLGDIRAELEKIRRLLGGEMPKRKPTPEERDERRRQEAESAARLQKLRELVERGWRELEARRAAAARGETELSPPWQPPPGNA
jgi:hypothetical protein